VAWRLLASRPAAYSSRRTTTGSILEARSAGTSVAMTVAPARIAATDTEIVGFQSEAHRDALHECMTEVSQHRHVLQDRVAESRKPWREQVRCV